MGKKWSGKYRERKVGIEKKKRKQKTRVTASLLNFRSNTVKRMKKKVKIGRRAFFLFLFFGGTIKSFFVYDYLKGFFRQNPFKKVHMENIERRILSAPESAGELADLPTCPKPYEE